MSSGKTRAHDCSEENTFVFANEEGNEEEGEEQLFQHEVQGEHIQNLGQIYERTSQQQEGYC
jgi:hypothetical protein